MIKDNECDIIVVGGGPAGATAGALLSSRGWNVTVFEADQHPRFHIGESLLPMNLPIFEQLGVLDGVKQIGTFKPGADFTIADKGAMHQSFPFNRALRDSPPHAYQVKRSELDALLLSNCREQGATVLENHKVTRIDLMANGRHRVQVESSDGIQSQWLCKYLLDASGQQTVLASQQKWRTRNKDHASAAIFAHFENVAGREGTEQGNISIYWIDAGWIWMIPLKDGRMSVGAVCRPDYLKQRRSSQEAFLLETIKKSDTAAARMNAAECVSETRVAANYSYFSRQQIGPGYALIGDAYAFIDPVFSSGVYLAMSSAASIVPVAEAWLRKQSIRHQLQAWLYKRKMRKGLAVFSWFIYRFNTPTMNTLFRNPRNVLKVEQAVTSMLAGDVYRGGMVSARLLVFKFIFNMTRIFGNPPQPTGRQHD